MQVSQDIEDISFWMWFTLIFIIGLVFFIIILSQLFYKNILKKEQLLNESKLEHQKKLLKTTIETQEKERKRIAENLHDDVISQLYRIKLMNTDASINTLLKEGITTTREISHALSPPMLDTISVKELIEDFINPYQQKYAINFTATSKENSTSISSKLNIFRILQEVITNCNKHAKADALDIIWRASKKYVSLIIKDNGIGIDPKVKNGMGFKNIESRTQTLGGHYKFKQNQPNGTTFILLANNE